MTVKEMRPTVATRQPLACQLPVKPNAETVIAKVGRRCRPCGRRARCRLPNGPGALRSFVR
jgi:hypothetical protein